MRVREMAAGEESDVLALVMAGFDELVRPDFTDEGAAEFFTAARTFVIERPPGHSVMVAERDGRLLGMIDMRDSSHICLFFVAAAERGRGLGRRLFEAAVAEAMEIDGPREITVNSSPWAVRVYERLGFASTGPMIEHHGMCAVPMCKVIRPRV